MKKYLFLGVFIFLSSCNTRLDYLHIKTDNELVEVEFKVVGIPGWNDPPSENYILDIKKNLDWLGKTCDSLEINRTVAVAKDSSFVKVWLSIDNFEVANTFMRLARRRGCNNINVDFKEDAKYYYVNIDANSSAFPSYKHDWIPRGKITLENVDSDIKYFPKRPTECLDVNEDNSSTVTFTLKSCEKTISSPLKKITYTYPKTRDANESWFSEKKITYVCMILGGLASIIAILTWLTKK